MILITILAFILVLGLLIFVHEFGHFITAKLSGVRVDEFAFGFPPRLLSVRKGETEYSINLIPVGGYVKLMGEEDPSQPRSFASKKAWQRLIMLAAGPFMNAVLPILLFSVAFMVPRQALVGDVSIAEVQPASPAALAGIEEGDIVRSINGITLDHPSDLLLQIQLNLGEETTLVIADESGVEKTVTLTPRWNPPEGQGAVGIKVGLVNERTVSLSDPVWRAVPKGVQQIGETLAVFQNEVTRWFVQRQAPQVTGPVGIFEITGQAAQAGPSYLMQFAAFLSINLAIINIIPLPALDGGRIFFVVLEILRRGKRVSPSKERLIHGIGFAFLISLIVAITVFDIIRVAGGQSLFP